MLCINYMSHEVSTLQVKNLRTNDYIHIIMIYVQENQAVVMMMVTLEL